MRFIYHKTRWLLSGMFFLSVCAFADNCGTFGQTYPIDETDFLVFIDNRLHSMEKDGSLQKAQNQWQSDVMQSIERPKSVGLTPIPETHTFHYDPTFIAGRDVMNAQGDIVVKKGTRVNPLERLPLFQETLIFYNDDDVDARAWVKKYLDEHAMHQAIKVILVQGNVKAASRALIGRAVYFDQRGVITHRLSIQHTPAIVTREGNQLLITEIGQKEYSHG